MATLKSLIYISNGNLPSKMAHTIQVAKMAQALSQQLDNFELIAGGDIKSALKGMDAQFQAWYGLQRPFKLVRLPAQLRANYPFPQDYQNYRYPKLAVLYACLKAPSLAFTRSIVVAQRLLAVGIPVIWEKHELMDENYAGSQLLGDKNLLGFVTISQKLADRAIQLGLPADKALVVHSGVDLASFLPYQTKELARQKLSLAPDAKIVLYSGHLYDYKGIPTMLDLAFLMPQCQFMFVGGWAEDIERVRQECDRRSLQNVRLIGHVSQTDLPPYLYAADVLVVPTSKTWHLGETTSPLKLFEYMAVKRPIVASALPTVMTVLRDRENALLAESDEPLAFKKAVVDLLENPTLATKITEKAFQDVQNFTWDKRAEQIVTFAAERLKTFEGETTRARNLVNYIKRNAIPYLKF